jgi:hypothetical protein
MIKFYVLVFCLILFISLNAIPVSSSTAMSAAQRQLSRMNLSIQYTISNSETIKNNTTVLGFVYSLLPGGYIVVSADDNLPPIIAYSTTTTFDDAIHQKNILREIITHDLSLRLQNVYAISQKQKEMNKDKWNDVLHSNQPLRFQQWPPEGTTASGGWLKTQWTQSAPFNNDCPMDHVTGNRSQAGCPAVAMGQIVNYYATINGTTFSDSDDYHHIYSGNNYWIDNDAATYGFLSFPDLNSSLSSMMHHYRYQEEITNNDKAALVFACGVAAHQVYASAGSGTFSVNQALQAYQRFGFTTSRLESEDIPELYMDISSDIIHARPVHLAIESQDETTGHNVVVDGYNTDEYYHLNFGWGSAYDGWYLLPTELPFGLTMIEGAIVNIKPIEYISVSPATLLLPTPVQVDQFYSITIQNIYSESDVTIEDDYFDASFAGITWQVLHDTFPKVLAPGEITQISFSPQSVGSSSGNLYQTYLRIITDKNAKDVEIQYQSPVINADENHTPSTTSNNILASLSSYPNPYSVGTYLRYHLLKSSPVAFTIYNAKGEQINHIDCHIQTQGEHVIHLYGIDKKGNQLASGIYFYRIKAGNEIMTRKMIVLQ